MSWFNYCFLGILIIPQIAHMIYIIVSNTIDKQNINDEKRKKKHLVLIEGEHLYWSLSKTLIQNDEFS